MQNTKSKRIRDAGDKLMIKNRLLQIRLGMGYKKQIDFANFLGLSKSQYNRLENNREQPTLECLFMMTKKLNLKLEDIVYYINEPSE